VKPPKPPNGGTRNARRLPEFSAGIGDTFEREISGVRRVYSMSFAATFITE
jgi:hypothetical protein